MAGNMASRTLAGIVAAGTAYFSSLLSYEAYYNGAASAYAQERQYAPGKMPEKVQRKILLARYQELIKDMEPLRVPVFLENGYILITDKNGAQMRTFANTFEFVLKEKHAKKEYAPLERVIFKEKDLKYLNFIAGILDENHDRIIDSKEQENMEWKVMYKKSPIMMALMRLFF